MHRHRALGGSRHPARHPGDQRRLRGARDLAAAVLRPDRRRPDRPDRRRARRQPDAARDRGELGARPDRRGHEGRPDDGRGRREPGARGQAPRGVRPGARRDHEAVRRPGGAAGEGRQAEVARRLDGRRAPERPRPRDLGADPAARPARGRRDRRRAAGAARAAALDGLHPGGHHPPAAGPLGAPAGAREAAARRRRGFRAGAVRGRPPRLDGRGAGSEGAPLGEAPASLRPDRRDRGAAVPGRPGDRSRARARPSRTS